MDVTRRQLLNTDGSIVNSEHLSKSTFVENENDKARFDKPVEPFHLDPQWSVPKAQLPENTLFIPTQIKKSVIDGWKIYYTDIAAVAQTLKSKKEYVAGMEN